MSESNNTWVPPAKIEDLYAKTDGNKFSGINRPTAGPREDKQLDKGSAAVQLYSLATPNGQKVGILLEELAIDYDAHIISIMKGEQFTSGFVDVNPNSKIPAAVDYSGPNAQPVHLFESGSILQYFAEKHGQFIPKDPVARVACFNWLYWQMGGFGPFCGQFGHFFSYAPADQFGARDYGTSRYGMEVQRLCSVLDRHFADANNQYLAGSEYSIADMAVFPWYQHLRNGGYKNPGSGSNSKDFLSTDQYSHANAWADRLAARPAVQRGMTVCSNGKGKPWLDTA